MKVVLSSYYPYYNHHRVIGTSMYNGVLLLLPLVRLLLVVILSLPGTASTVTTTGSSKSVQSQLQSQIQLNNDKNHYSTIIDPIIEEVYHRSSKQQLQPTNSNNYKYNRKLKSGDFTILNERWKNNNATLPLQNISIVQDVLLFPLTIELTNGICTQLSIDDILWTYNNDSGDKQNNQANQKSLVSNFTIQKFGIVCTMDLSYSYMLISSSTSIYIDISDSTIQTQFTLDTNTVEKENDTNNNTTTNFNLYINTCTSDVTIQNLQFIGNQPGNNILNIISTFISDTVSNQIEEQTCTIITNLETKFRTFISDLTNTFINTNTTTTGKSLLQAEENLKLSLNSNNNNVQLIDYQDNPKASISTNSTTSTSIVQEKINYTNYPVLHLLDTLQSLSGLSLIVNEDEDNDISSNGTGTSSSSSSTKKQPTWTKWLFPNSATGFVIDLSTNQLLNGPNGFVSSIVQPKTTSTTTANTTGSTSSNNSGVFGSMFTFVNNNNRTDTSDPESTNTNLTDTSTKGLVSTLITEFFGITNIIVKNVAIIGIDNALSTFTGLTAIGQYTLELQLKVENIQLLIDIELTRDTVINSDNNNVNNENNVITTGDDTIFTRNSTTSGSSSSTTQIIQIGFNTSNDSSFRTGILVPINKNNIQNLQLGSFLYGTYTIINCFSSLLYPNTSSLIVTGFDANPNLQLESVFFNGLLSTGMDRLLTTGLQYIFTALYNSFDNIVSSFLTNVDLLSFLISNTTTDSTTTGTNDVCPAPLSGTGQQYIDVRDLFLSPATSINYGGSGLQPYGNFTWELLQRVSNVLSSSYNFTNANNLFNYSTQFTFGKRSTRNKLQFALSNFYLFNPPSTNTSKIQTRQFQNNTTTENQNNNSSRSNGNILLGGIQNEAYETRNYIQMNKVRTGGIITFNVDLGESQLYATTSIDMTITKIEILILLLLKINEQQFLQYPITSILDIHCWLSLFSTNDTNTITGSSTTTDNVNLALSKLVLLIEDVILDIQCLECSTIVDNVVSYISQTNYTNDINKFLNQIISIATNNGTTYFVQSTMNNLVAKAPQRCPTHPLYNYTLDRPSFLKEIFNVLGLPDEFLTENTSPTKVNRFGKSIGLIISSFVFGIIALLLYVVAKHVSQRRATKRFQSTIEMYNETEILLIAAEQIMDSEQNKGLDTFSGSLYTNDVVPKWARYLIPIGLLIISVLYWLALFFPFMGIIVFGQVPNDSTRFTVFTLSYSLSELISLYWDRNGLGKVLAFILVFVVINPGQFRIISTLIFWYLPTTNQYGSYTRRGYWLSFFNSSSRFVIIAVFVAIVSASAYQGSIELRIIDIKFFLVPQFGVFACLLGHALSTLVCRRVTHYHEEIKRQFELQSNAKLNIENSTRMLQGSDIKEEKMAVDAVSSFDDITSKLSKTSVAMQPLELYNTSFIRPHCPECLPLQVRPLIRYAFVGGCASISMFALLGCILPLYYYDITGFLSILVVMKDDSTRNVFSLMTNLMDTAIGVGNAKTLVGMIVLIMMMLLTLLIIPITLSIILLVRWIKPLHDTTHVRLRFIQRNLESWNFAGALFFGIVVCAINGNQLTNIIAASICGTLSTVIRTLIYWGILDETVSECIIIDSRAKISILFFLTISLMLRLLSGFIDSAYDQRQNQYAPKRVVTVDDLANFDKDTLIAKSKQLDAPNPIFTDRFRWVLETDNSKKDNKTTNEETSRVDKHRVVL